MSAPRPDADALIQRFRSVRARTERLAESLSPEDQTVQSMPDTSPTKWHRAHATWFFETFVLQPHVDGFEPHHPRYGYLFNSYYEAVGERHPRPTRGMITRPGAAEVAQYRSGVDERIVELLAAADPALLNVLAPLIDLGTHHEEQHQELLLMDIKHLFGLNSMQPAYVDHKYPTQEHPGALGWVDFAGGVVPIGSPADSAGFAFDNEFPRHDALLAPYRLADRLVTCGEWQEFIDDGGYQRPELWLSDGWYRRLDQGWEAPLYWRIADIGREADGLWRIHTLAGTREIDPHEPVGHVSFYEADAYATWRSVRLPTEFEWEAASSSVPAPDPAAPDSPFLSPDPMAGPLHPFGAGRPTGGLRQMYGDCWEWTGSPYRPYPGYRVPEGAIGEYNGKFMINTMSLRGGCRLTPPGHIRPTYRNFFHPHTRWHLSGVRLASDR